MRVFVTGASGFVGSAIVQQLLQSGHEVLGLVRSDQAAAAVQQTGAEVLRGDVNDPECSKTGAAACDAVIHTAFNHDFSRFKANCEDDRRVILGLGEALTGTGKPLVVTSGTGLLRSDSLAAEEDKPAGSDITPRAASEEAAHTVAATGVDTYIVRLPPTVHGPGDHGFIAMVIDADKEKGTAAYVGLGNNRWPAVHRLDAALMYRLIVEQRPEQKVFHAVAEEGIAFRRIAEAIGTGLQLPVERKDGEGAEAHFGWFTHFAAMDCPASSEQSRRMLNWKPVHPGLMEDLESGIYFN